MRLFARAAASLLALGLLAWLAGFAWFVRQARQVPAPPPRTDGIVVLTGGSERIAAGLRLLADGSAARLLVSGVGPGTDASRLLRHAAMDPAGLAGRITLGQSAVSTHGNAEETVEWVRRYDLHSLIVVTAFYHMPRALAELRHALPGIALHAAPVDPATDGARRLQLLASEYTKWLAVQAGLPRPILLIGAADRREGAGLK